MIKIYYGDEDQNDLMNMIKNYKGEEDMEENRIQQIQNDINAYREAIANAEGALEAAEQELTEELESRYSTDRDDIPE